MVYLNGIKPPVGFRLGSEKLKNKSHTVTYHPIISRVTVWI